MKLVSTSYKLALALEINTLDQIVVDFNKLLASGSAFVGTSHYANFFLTTKDGSVQISPQ
ncbi:hypothetical protein A9Q86_01495 [Flavobacteriales bacterium 33_180_T64]|nr:hypothetical protein A9Q86_01495 [Flavobacteriales bacterium 33_180_T64]